MFERFTRDAKASVLRAIEAAMGLGSEQVEPQHLLLGLAADRGAAGRALAEAGMDRATIAAAIEADLAATLETIGVPPSVLDAAPVRPTTARPDIGAPARSALEQSMREAGRAGDRKLGSEYLLLGLLRPPAPTLARVLARHDVEPERLAALVEMELAAGRR